MTSVLFVHSIKAENRDLFPRMDAVPLLTLLGLASTLVAGLEKDLACAVCRSVVDEVHYSISKVDPKKRVQVGSFRVDSKGNQAVHEKPYARSEIHLMETLESICENFRDYAETTNDAGKRAIVRTRSRDGKALRLKDIKISGDLQKVLKFNCEGLIEDFEEDMIKIFRKENIPEEEVDRKICGEITELCTEEDLDIPLPVVEYESMEELEKYRDSIKTEEGAADTEEGTTDTDKAADEEGGTDPDVFNEFLKDSLDVEDKDSDKNEEDNKTDRDEL